MDVFAEKREFWRLRYTAVQKVDLCDVNQIGFPSDISWRVRDISDFINPYADPVPPGYSDEFLSPRV